MPRHGKRHVPPKLIDRPTEKCRIEGCHEVTYGAWRSGDVSLMPWVLCSEHAKLIPEGDLSYLHRLWGDERYDEWDEAAAKATRYVENLLRG